MSDPQHQRTPLAVAQLLALMSGVSDALDRPRDRLFAIDLAAAPSSTLAPRWYGQQPDGTLADVLDAAIPWRGTLAGPWWCNPPFGWTCRSCGGASPSKACRPAGHDVVDLRVWAPTLAAWARLHRGVVLCKLDPSTGWFATLEGAAEARVDFSGFRVAYEVETDAGWVQRPGANFCSTAFLVGPDARGAPPVIRCDAGGGIHAGPAGWAVLRRRGCSATRGPVLAGWKVAQNAVSEEATAVRAAAGAGAGEEALRAAAAEVLAADARGALRVRRGAGRPSRELDLIEVERAVEAHGVRGAARALGVPHALVQRRMRTAEDIRRIVAEAEAMGVKG